MGSLTFLWRNGANAANAERQIPLPDVMRLWQNKQFRNICPVQRNMERIYCRKQLFCHSPSQMSSTSSPDIPRTLRTVSATHPRFPGSPGW